jgi:2-oxo-4-hydroxy-4-carboxy-5-ureidoimidazoline decarboxylase
LNVAVTAVLTIHEVNALDRDAFVARFGGVYEATPALAAQAWSARPFADRAELCDAFAAASARLDDSGALALLRAHPQLGTGSPMTRASRSEQASAGLTELDAETRDRITAGNARYRERFGFPFIIAVRGRQPAEVLSALDDRLEHTAAAERAIALAEVQRIAELRITQLVAP